jgi:hypothetical protein
VLKCGLLEVLYNTWARLHCCTAPAAAALQHDAIYSFCFRATPRVTSKGKQPPRKKITILQLQKSISGAQSKRLRETAKKSDMMRNVKAENDSQSAMIEGKIWGKRLLL